MKKIVLTGGPGAGKTVLLETARLILGNHVAFCKEAANILFSGGFPRAHDVVSQCAAQRAIFHVQLELERMAEAQPQASVVLCDRGTLDGLAYWPLEPSLFWQELETTEEEQMARYAAVIHLKPASAKAYEQNQTRIETPCESALIDARIAQVWSKHPHRVVIESNDNFMSKMSEGLQVLSTLLAKTE